MRSKIKNVTDNENGSTERHETPRRRSRVDAVVFGLLLGSYGSNRCIVRSISIHNGAERIISEYFSIKTNCKQAISLTLYAFPPSYRRSQGGSDGQALIGGVSIAWARLAASIRVDDGELLSLRRWHNSMSYGWFCAKPRASPRRVG